MRKKKLILTEAQKDCLSKIGWVEVTRNNLLLTIKKTSDPYPLNYDIHVYNPYDSISVADQMQEYSKRKDEIKK